MGFFKKLFAKKQAKRDKATRANAKFYRHLRAARKQVGRKKRGHR